MAAAEFAEVARQGGSCSPTELERLADKLLENDMLSALIGLGLVRDHLAEQAYRKAAS